MSRNVVLLLIVCIALGAYVYKYEIIEVEKTREADAKAKKVFQFEDDALTGVVITRNDSTLELVKRDEDWYMRQPIYHRANSLTVSSLTSSIGYAETERVVEEEPASLDAFGLNPPAVTLVASSEEKTDTLLIGNKNATGSFIYVKRPGSPEVLLTSLGLLTNSTKSVTDFRDKKALVLGENDVERAKTITIAMPNSEIVVSQSDSSAIWMLEKPVQDKADADAVRSLINQMRDANVGNWLSDERSQNLKSFGLDPPRRSVEMRYGVSDHVVRNTMLLGNRVTGEDATTTTSAQYYGKDVTRDAVFVIDSSQIGNILADVKKLRYKKIAEFERMNVNRIKLDYGSLSFICEQDSANMWQVVQPEKKQGKDWRISGIVSDLEALNATGFLSYNAGSLSQYGLSSPKIEVTMMNYDETILTIAFGRTVGEDTYCLNKSTKRIYKVRSEDAEDFQFTLDDLTEPPPETESETTNSTSE